MKLSDKGRALLIELEGKRNHAYQDVVGLRTIGVGHLIKLTCSRSMVDAVNRL